MNFESAINAGTFAGFVLLFSAATAWYIKIVRPEQVALLKRGEEERAKQAKDIVALEERVDKLENRLQSETEKGLRYRLLLIEHGIPIPDP